MKKLGIILLLAASLLAAGCHDTIDAPSPHEQQEVVNQAETDFYKVNLAQDWQWEAVRYAEDIPVSDVLFYDRERCLIGGGTIVIAPHDSLSDLPDQIKVTREETTAEGWIIGKIEVVGNALGGDTSSEYHALIPLHDDWQMHEYIDLRLDGQRYDQATLRQLAETVVLRNQQFFGFIENLRDGQLTIVRAQYVSGADTALQQALGVTEEQLSRGFAIVPTADKKVLSISTDVQYYLVDEEEQLFKEVSEDDFLHNLQAHPEDVYDVTVRDEQVILIEERLL